MDGSKMSKTLRKGVYPYLESKLPLSKLKPYFVLYFT